MLCYTVRMSDVFKIIVHAEEANADAIRQAIGDAGGGKVGNYSHCTFSYKGTGRFLPLDGANPTIGEVGKLESVAEESIEVVCEKAVVQDVVAAIKKAHSYEEPAIEVYALANLSSF